MREGRYDFSVISTFLAAGMEDAIGRMVHPASARMSFPAAFLYDWQWDDKRLPQRRERLDYILLSPSLMEKCRVLLYIMEERMRGFQTIIRSV